MPELWDLYDLRRNRTGEVLLRSEARLMPRDRLRYVVEIYTICRGKLLLTKRDPGKTYGNLWEYTGGSVIAGEDSQTGAARELFEETGIRREPCDLVLIRSQSYPDAILDSYLCVITDDEPEPEVRYQAGETVDHKWLTRPDAEEFMHKPEFAAHIVPRYEGIADMLWNVYEILRNQTNVIYRQLKSEDEIALWRFEGFDRYQEVKECRRKIDGEWRVVPVEFTENWTDEDFRALVLMLKNTINTGGAVFASLRGDGRISGFVSVERELFGSDESCRYVNLSCIQVSREMRGRGIGKRLFEMAKAAARDFGAGKLYISGHSSVESQAFYRAMGCTEAVEYNKRLAELEPCDCQLECSFPE